MIFFKQRQVTRIWKIRYNCSIGNQEYVLVSSRENFLSIGESEDRRKHEVIRIKVRDFEISNLEIAPFTHIVSLVTSGIVYWILLADRLDRSFV